MSRLSGALALAEASRERADAFPKNRKHQIDYQRHYILMALEGDWLDAHSPIWGQYCPETEKV